MKLLREQIAVTSLPWREHLTLSSKESVTVDPSDGALSSSFNLNFALTSSLNTALKLSLCYRSATRDVVLQDRSGSSGASPQTLRET